MKFRTVIEPYKPAVRLSTESRLVSLGSCFSRAIGRRLHDGGINIEVTPMGILFNPLSIATLVERALDERMFTASDLYRHDTGTYHALALESRRQDTDETRLLQELNSDLESLSSALKLAECVMVTFGTSWCFEHLPTKSIVGNCHKLPDKDFKRHLCPVKDIVRKWKPLTDRLRHIVFTVSPVRHLNDGLHGNTLSKARLQLAVEELCKSSTNVEYFPAFEALNDDLRDYRFYADDLKHPSVMAEEYIFDYFVQSFYEKNDCETIALNRKKLLQSQHRPIFSAKE